MPVSPSALQQTNGMPSGPGAVFGACRTAFLMSSLVGASKAGRHASASPVVESSRALSWSRLMCFSEKTSPQCVLRAAALPSAVQAREPSLALMGPMPLALPGATFVSFLQIFPFFAERAAASS